MATNDKIRELVETNAKLIRSNTNLIQENIDLKEYVKYLKGVIDVYRRAEIELYGIECEDS